MASCKAISPPKPRLTPLPKGFAVGDDTLLPAFPLVF
jgi:hypothetical protein